MVLQGRTRLSHFYVKVAKVSYIVEVEKNYEAFKRCMKSVDLPMWNHIKNPHEYYQELANFIGNYYNFKCHLYNDLNYQDIVHVHKLYYQSANHRG